MKSAKNKTRKSSKFVQCSKDPGILLKSNATPKDIADRLKYVREKVLRVRQEDISDKVGKSRTFVSNVESAKNKPGWDLIIAYVCDFNVDLNYILTGEGNPLKQSNSNGSMDEDLTAIMKAIASIKDRNPRLFEFIKLLCKYDIIQYHTLMQYGYIQYDERILNAMKHQDERDKEIQ